MKLLIDMNLSPGWVGVLNTVGIETLHWSTVGDPRTPDRINIDKLSEEPNHGA